MSKSLTVINILWAVADTIICSLAIIAFGWGASHFDKWWLLLLSIIPLLLFSQHSVIINSDLEAAKEEHPNV